MSRTVRARLLEIFEQILGMSEEELTTPNTKLFTLGMDSLDAVEIVMETEEEFDINISDEEAEGASTFDEFLALVESKHRN